MKNIAVILAAGSGVRSGFKSSKQLVKLAGKPVIFHTLKAFEISKFIDEIAVVSSKENYNEIQDLIHREGFQKVAKVIYGGQERWESSWAAIESYKNAPNVPETNLIFHDAVRPLIDESIIERVALALKEHQAIDVVINTVDTIIQADETGNYIDKILNRSQLRNGQTPQAFRYNLIKSAYEKAMQDSNIQFTDDCGIIKKYLPNEKIFLVNGNSFNHKLTYNEDLAILDKLFQLKRNLVTTDTLNNDLGKNLEQLKNKVVVVFGGSSGIGKEIYNILHEAQIKVYSVSRKESNCDISNVESVKATLNKINNEQGRIDCIINTAGILSKKSLNLMNYSDISETINTNYLGVINVAYAGFEYLKESKGCLLLFTSSSYTYGRAYYSLYSSSKAAVVNFVQAISEEWSDFNIKVNCISPERTLTPMRINAFGHEDPKTLLDAKDVAKASIKTLCLKESGLIIDVKKPQ